MSDERSPEEIREDILEHRAELGESLEALSHKLDVPARAKGQAAALKDTATSQPVRLGAIAGGAAMTLIAALLLLRTRKK